LNLIENNKLIEGKIGFYHNLILKENINLINKDTSIEEIKKLIISTLIEENPKLFNRGNTSNIIAPHNYIKNTILNKNENKNKNNIGFSIIFDNLKDNNLISLKLTEKLKKINLDIFEKRYTDREILAKVNSLKLEDFNQKERKSVNAFVQVFNASHIFWAERKNKFPSQGSKMSCNQQLILADAAGALYGSILGPISSIVQGALFSLISSEQGACEVQ
jgi:hypothetical protein